jgi:hypothetical protein
VKCYFLPLKITQGSRKGFSEEEVSKGGEVCEARAGKGRGREELVKIRIKFGFEAPGVIK